MMRCARGGARWSSGRFAEDTWVGVDMLRNLAVTYATLGEADSAVKQPRVLLELPSWIIGAGAAGGSHLGAHSARPRGPGADRGSTKGGGVASC
jgi:hypothetical protein